MLHGQTLLCGSLQHVVTCFSIDDMMCSYHDCLAPISWRILCMRALCWDIGYDIRYMMHATLHDISGWEQNSTHT